MSDTIITAVVGAQWGDEGKGKIIDIIAKDADVVLRANGGNNAGHTVVSGEETYKLHLIPSGILYPGTLCLIGAGVVADPKSLCSEIDGLLSRGVSFNNFLIDYRAHIVTPWNIAFDNLSEQKRGEAKIGTTGRGIGPCYMDKYERSGIRLCDLIDKKILAEKLSATAPLKNEIIQKIYGEKPIDVNEVIKIYSEYGEKLKKYAADVSVIADTSLKKGKKLMLEGAQAALLDIDFGTYPYVTSSHPTVPGLFTGAGIGFSEKLRVIGVLKAYTTRVGMGPFPTELFDDIGDTIRTKGYEYGTTTGRPRRTGWFDSVIARHSVRINALTELAVNKLDTLSGISKLKICTHYETSSGEKIYDYPPSIEKLAECSPVYETIEGFDCDISNIRKISNLPSAALSYIKKIEETTKSKVTMVGVGPARTQIAVE